MLSKEDLGRLLDYTVWANHRVVRAAATLSKSEFQRDLKASHGGVRGTLTHMLGAEWIWLERWKGTSPPRGIDEGEFATLMALHDRWKTVEEHRASWFENLPEEAPASLVLYKTLDGRPYETLLWQLVQHVANHSTYHRGQVITMLKQLGAKVVSTDMVIWDRDPKKRRGAG
jgi:uncharacterized damage-inducible protein DinB